MVVAGGAGARRAERLILCRRAPYLSAEGYLRALFPLVAAARYWPGGGSRRSGAGGARRRAQGARGRARRCAGRPRRGRPRGRRGGHRQDAARGRARPPRPRGGLRDPARPVDRSRRHRAALPTVRRGPALDCWAAARRGHGPQTPPQVPSCGSSRRRSRSSPVTRPPRRCCSYSRTCTGPIRQRLTWSCSSPTTWPNDPWYCSPPTGGTSPPRRGACAGSPTAYGARARAWCSNSARSRPGS